jgi:hypothetical protein
MQAERKNMASMNLSAADRTPKLKELKGRSGLRTGQDDSTEILHNLWKFTAFKENIFAIS